MSCKYCKLNFVLGGTKNRYNEMYKIHFLICVSVMKLQFHMLKTHKYLSWLLNTHTLKIQSDTHLRTPMVLPQSKPYGQLCS